VVEEGFYLGSRQRAGMAFVMKIDQLADPVLVAVLGAGTVVAATGRRWILGPSDGVRCAPMMSASMVDDQKLEHNIKA
jgi:hypothetical protein